MTQSIRSMMIDLGHQMSEENNAAHDLWTWLPSYKDAQKHHGDYASEHRPALKDVIVEASMFISHKLNPTPEQLEEAGDLYRCPCGNHE